MIHIQTISISTSPSIMMLRILLLVAIVSLYTACAADGTVNKTIIEWQRQLRTCDAVGDMDIPLTGTSRLLYAIGDNKPTADDDIDYHRTRGIKNINLLDKPPANIPLPDDAQVLKIMSDVFFPPVQETFYLCQGFKTQNFTQKNHIVRFTPQIDYANAALVHHILLFGCPNGLNAEDLAYKGNCYATSPQMPTGLRNCDQVQVAAGWAVGGGELILPPLAGYPIGPGETFWMLQIHYHNVEGVSYNDSAGFDMYYTPTLRTYDAASLEVSRPISTILIPPKSQSYVVDAYCPAQCFNGLNNSGVNVYGSFLHTHLAGVSVRVQHQRKGVELEDLDLNTHYDFNFQQTVQFEPGTKMIQNGDDIHLSCTYNTMDRTAITRGGLSTSDEMCIAYLFYYPANTDPAKTFTQCMSRPATGSNYVHQCNGVNGWQQITQVPPKITTPLPPVGCTTSPLGHRTYTNGTATTTFIESDQFNGSAYTHSEILDDDGLFKLYWDFSVDNAKNGIINFAAEVVTNGWFGLGISESGKMYVADSVIGWVDTTAEGASNNVVDLTDRLNVEYSQPHADASQDVFNIRGTRGAFPIATPPRSPIYYNYPDGAKLPKQHHTTPGSTQPNQRYGWLTVKNIALLSASALLFVFVVVASIILIIRCRSVKTDIADNRRAILSDASST